MTARPDPAAEGLPLPDDAARAHSARMVGAVRDAIVRAGGWIAFETYMRLVLYAPGLGYYVAGTRKFGASGDFVTAPELTPLFGASVAGALAPVLESTRGEVLELGAGSGALASSLLAEWERLGRLPSRYHIVEVSPDLRERQRAHLLAEVPELVHRVVWADDLPSSHAGVIVMNEVLDAIPAHVVVRRGGLWYERGVVWGDGGFALADRPLENRQLLELAIARLPPELDYTGELNPAAEALVQTLARRLHAGSMLVVDYGFERSALYHSQRSSGTLMGHYRHRAHGDPFLWPGLSDLTTHVDFDAVAEAGARGGLEVETYSSQARFLLDAGLLDRLAAVGAPESLNYLRSAAAVQTLLSPAEMGDLFKAMVLVRR